MKDNRRKMPVLFVGHGNPMNALEDNELTQAMKRVGEQLPTPKGILCISAHWFTEGLRVQSDPEPRQIYDFYGFPKKLYELKYPARGSKELSDRVLALLSGHVSVDDSWGIDHGTWSVLVHLFPDASVPVVQLSVDKDASPEELLEVGKKLKPLSDEGWLILASGNILHNLQRIDWNMEGATPEGELFDLWVKEAVELKMHQALLRYQDHPSANYAVPTTDHFYPLYYVLGASDPDSLVEVFNEEQMMGSISMTSYVFWPDGVK